MSDLGGNDVMLGGASFLTGPGDDVAVGQLYAVGARPNAILTYADRTAPVTVTLADDGSGTAGGPGDHDTADLGDATGPLTVDLTGTGPTGTFPGADDLLGGIENVHGGPYDDVITGTAGRNVVTGGAGADVIRGGAGDDQLSGDDGDNQVYGGAGSDRLTGAGLLDGGDGPAADTIDYCDGNGPKVRCEG